jgi:GNAT superfamily N-acetyltransferase
MISITYETTVPKNESEQSLKNVQLIRNRNRLEKKSLEYVFWRYQGQENAGGYDIFWVNYNDQKVGMAAVIRRPYYLYGKKKQLLVLGDISLDKEYRKKGVADQLFEAMHDFYSDGEECGFVFPNNDAKRVLTSHGWDYVEPLIHYVLLLNPYKRIRSFTKSHTISIVSSTIVRFLLKLRLSFVNSKEYEIKFVNNFPDTLDEFFTEFDKSGYVISDKTLDSLVWRYSETYFGPREIILFYKHGRLIGFCVYKYGDDNTVCYVYDFLCLKKTYAKFYLKLILEYFFKKNIYSVRLMFNKSNIYVNTLKSFGFIGRNEGGGVYGFNANDFFYKGNSCMMFSLADKDV